MTPERIRRDDDEGLYQPRIHSQWIRKLHKISLDTGEPMTVLVDRALREYVALYGSRPSPSVEPQTRHDGKRAGERVTFHKTYEIVGWVYEGDLHCGECARRRFGVEMKTSELVDREGNVVTPLFLGDTRDDDSCGDCGSLILEGL